MENPSRLLRRAAISRQGRGRAAAPSPAPQQAEKPPQHVSSHASYTALMRSHDRMSTRHIAPRSGA